MKWILDIHDMKNKKNNGILLIWTIIILIFVVAFIYIEINKTKTEAVFNQEQEQIYRRKLQKPSLANLVIDTSAEHMQGNPDTAQVIVIEYSDTECRYCKTFYYKFQEQILKIYQSEVALVYRHFPLPIYPKSKKEAEALECAADQGGNKMFWKYLDELYQATPSDNGLDPLELPRIAQKGNLDIIRFNRCLDENNYTEKVAEQRLVGEDLGIRQTPSVIIWDKTSDKKQLINGANSRFLEIKTIIEGILQTPSK